MKTIHFISGLGSTEESTQLLNTELNKHGYEIRFLDIPGQYSNVNVKIADEKDFVVWLKNTIPKNSIVMAFYMGADLALKFNKMINPSDLIILDGGIIGYDFDNRDLEQDIQETRDIIIKNTLNMNPDTISNLISIIADDYKDIFNVDLHSRVLFIVADSPNYVFEYKKNKIDKYYETNRDDITIKIIQNTTHEIYTQKPRYLSEQIVEWLKKEEKWNLFAIKTVVLVKV